MRFYEFTIKPIKPLSLQQARISALTQQKERANTQLKVERDRQKKANATKKLQQAQQTLAKIS